MSKQATLSRWFRPAGKPAAAQKQALGRDSQVDPVASPSHRITLLDALAELDVNALRVLVGHLEAAKWCCPARLACKALRDVVDTGVSRVQLPLPLDEDGTSTAGSGGASVSPLLKWPSCTRVRLTFCRDWEDIGEDGGESADGGGKFGEGGRGLDGVEGSGEQEEGAAQVKDKGAAPSREDVGQPVEEQEQRLQQQGGEGQEGGKGDEAAAEEEGHDGNEHSTQFATELATSVFQGLPAGQQERIADLELDMGQWEEYPAVNLSHLLEALGPLLPCLQHINLVECQLFGWEVEQGESNKRLGAALAAAFPRLTAATLNKQPPLTSLGTHMGTRLERLVLSGLLYAPEEEHCKELVAQLPHALRRFTALKELMVEQLHFECDEGEDAEEELFGGGLTASECAFVRLLDSLPPALETLHLNGFRIDTDDLPGDELHGQRMELGLRGGALRVLRLGWDVTRDQLNLIHDLVGRSRLRRGVGRIPLLQLAGLVQLDEEDADEDADSMWSFLNKHFERFEIGRLHIGDGTSPGAMAALVQRYGPEEVASDDCLVRLRGTGPPLSFDFVCPRWRLDLGGVWTEDVHEGYWATPAPGVGPELAAAGLRLETAGGAEAAAGAAGALRASVTDVLAAAAAAAPAADGGGGAGGAQRGRQGAHGDKGKGGLVLHERPSRYTEGMLLLAGPFVRMLGPKPAVDAWLGELCAGAAAAREKDGKPQEYYLRSMTGNTCYARVSLPHVATAGRTGAASSGPGAAAGAAAAAGADVVLLLQFAYCFDLDWVATQLAKQAGTGPPGSMHQGMFSGLQVARVQGSCVGPVLYGDHFSPVSTVVIVGRCTLRGWGPVGGHTQHRCQEHAYRQLQMPCTRTCLPCWCSRLFFRCREPNSLPSNLPCCPQSYPHPQVLQALWDGSEGCGLGERQRLEKLFGLWGAVTGIATFARVPLPETDGPADVLWGWG